MIVPNQISTQRTTTRYVAPAADARPAIVEPFPNGHLETIFALLRRATGATHVALQMAGTGPQALPDDMGACLRAAVIRDGVVVGVLRAGVPHGVDFKSDAQELLEDSAALVSEQMALWTAARVDALTGAMARGAFTEALEQRIASYHRTGAVCSLIMLDLDHFKSFNDQYGHAAGDEVLRRVSDSIREQLRAEDSFGRLGGEEFAVIVRGDTSVARDVAERLRKAVLAADVPEMLKDKVSASFGIASCSSDCADVDTLMNDADTQLYRAKRGGRNRVCSARTASANSSFAH